MNISLKFNKFQIFTVFIIITLIILPCFPSLVNGKEEKNLTKIMGENYECSANQMYLYLIKNNDPKGNNPISKKYAKSFVKTTIKEAKKEGVRADIAFCVMMHETGYLNFKGDVKKEQNNFAGLGTTGGGVKGASFKTMEIGIRAVVQHLKCYASTEPLNQKCVDPRWNNTLRNKAKYVEYLGYADNPYKKGWAYPGKGYGKKVLKHLENVKKINNKDAEEIEERSNKILFKRKNPDTFINKSLSISFNILTIYLLLLIFYKINKADKKTTKYITKRTRNKR